VLAAGGLWFGRIAWRVRHELVTLHVRKVPVAEVLRRIERQTQKKIRAEKAVGARITLNVVNKPLSYVLDRVAEQAGAQWSTLYAVYDSPGSLRALESALSGDGKIEPAGWTRIAPGPTPVGGPEPNELGYLTQPGPNLEVRKLPPNFAPAGVASGTEDVTAAGPAPGKRGEMPSGPLRMRIVRKGGPDGTGAVQEEVWTPEELVMEAALNARLGSDRPDSATPTTAAETAQKVKGRWTTVLAFRKSAMGIGFGGMPFPRSRPGDGKVRLRRPMTGTNDFNLPEGLGNVAAEFEEAAKRERDAQFARLTPEQRVQRARERQSLNQK